MTIKKLAKMPYAQAHVVIDDENNISLISYYTKVINLTADGWLTCSGTYSQTTRKHISAFMREYTNGDYYTAKAAYENDLAVNIYTNETKSAVA